MLFMRVNRSNPEKVFIVVKNSYSTASLTNGQAVAWDHQTDADGVGVTKPFAYTTSLGADIAGVAAETIAAGAYGLVQVWGYHSAVRARTMSTTGNGGVVWRAVAAGVPLSAPLTAAFCLEGISGASTSIIRFPVGFALAANAEYTTAAIAAFLKCL